MRWIALLTLIVATGCNTGKHFTDLGNGTGVPTNSINAYAREHSLTHDEARKAMLAEIEARKAEVTP